MRRFTQSHREPELGADSRFAGPPDLASHQIGQLLGDGQTETCAAVETRRRVVRLAELLEQLLLLLRRDADSRVSDGEPNNGVAGGFRDQAGVH
jgi:hypothetical protein